ncbi:MAG: hypothetical protein NT069_05885 [Planctomycetota bacterium]|nr:hypothetical protein [Planctomycetota bacterium]
MITLRRGTDVCLFSTGDLLAEGLAAADILERSGLSVEVVSSPTVKPLDGDWLDSAFDRFSTVVTLEDHGLLGGFGAAVAEWLADGVPHSARLLRLGTPEVVFDVATEEPLDRRAALQPQQIAQQVLKRLKKRVRAVA